MVGTTSQKELLCVPVAEVGECAIFDIATEIAPLGQRVPILSRIKSPPHATSEEERAGLKSFDLLFDVVFEELSLH